MIDSARFPPRIDRTADGMTLRLAGAWVTASLVDLEPQLAATASGPCAIDAGDVVALDTGGANALRRLLDGMQAGGDVVELAGLRPEFRALLDLVDTRLDGYVSPLAERPPGLLERLGRGVVTRGREFYELLAFTGECTLALLRTLRHPGRLRWRAVVADIGTAGVDALPIIGLLSFLIGVVIAYQGGVQLNRYGANIFIVEMVALTMLRELAPVMAAVIVAGRTGSAYTAQIGTMEVNEEIDAMRSLGIPPLEMLVLPKLIGLMIALPLLTMFADVVGIFGGMVMAATLLDVSFAQFIDRLPEVVSTRSFAIGIGKAPVFALLIAAVGCFHGFRVHGDADRLGTQTTVSVVQGIFLVIVVDAVFSIMFSALRI
jgi:phospholipid/cholesterol/gamma-HCH transport system permease protein